MATDAKFDKVQKILPHENADSLEIAIVSNFPCVVRKGEFMEGDWTFYIRDDAKLVGYDEQKDGKEPSFLWQKPLLQYLGSGGRVKSIKLRKKVSMGILLDPMLVCEGAVPNLLVFNDAAAEELNERISDSEYGALYLKLHFGIEHWEAPLVGCSMGACNARGPLIAGLWKTDEENFQNIDDMLFPWNTEVLVTRKLDGSSCSISSTPDGDVHVMSRSLDLKLDDDNVWNRAAEPVIPLVKALAKHYSETVVVRGEVTGAGVNANKSNIDSKGDLSFNMFAVAFPQAAEDEKRIGLYGTQWHFLEVNKVCKELAGHEIKTVPIEGTAILTRKLLEDIADKPRSEGEGRVINTKSLVLPHFKSKSKDYLIHL